MREDTVKVSLTPQDKKRVEGLVQRIALKRDIPMWKIWKALYLYVAGQVMKV